MTSRIGRVLTKRDKTDYRKKYFGDKIDFSDNGISLKYLFGIGFYQAKSKWVAILNRTEKPRQKCVKAGYVWETESNLTYMGSRKCKSEEIEANVFLPSYGHDQP